MGHAGTLDPLASGVLVIGVGNGTRILQYLQSLPKTYRAGLALGCETDTQDSTGAVVQEADASAVTEEAFRSALSRFEGEIFQTPPMYSAVKVGGRRLYDLARRGETVHREGRPITICEAECLHFGPGARAAAEIRIRCSAGTYVRTLCHDLGRMLGPGAVMTALEREAVGHFQVADAIRLEDLDPGFPLLPLAEALAHLPGLVVGPEERSRLAHGQFVPAPETTPDGPIRVLSGDGALLAIGSVRGHGAARLVAPEKVFVTTDEASLRS